MIRSNRLLCLLACIATACATRPLPAGMPAELGADLTLRALAPGVWLFTALGDTRFGPYPANGLLVETANGSWLVDTAWRPEQAEALLEYAADVLHRPVRGAVVTHFHDDRTGGIAALVAHGLPVFATAKTRTLARLRGMPEPTADLAEGALPELVWLDPGPGHTPDNIVVYHPGSRTLFGGCLVKAGDARDLGNLADADPGRWAEAIERVRAAFPEVALVVPGHGAPGDRALLEHTRALTTATPPRPP